MEIFKTEQELQEWYQSLNKELLSYEPEGDRIFLQKAKVMEKTTKAGIILIKEAQERPNIGRIVAMGPDVFSVEEGKHPDRRFKVGDVIMYGKYAGSDLTFLMEDTDWDYMVTRTADVIARKVI